VHPLAEKVIARDLRGTARALRLVDDRVGDYLAVLKDLFPHTGRAWTLGVTGNPGAGKSTLTDRLITALRKQGRRVGVICIDPTSPFSGGAILGDRIRMQEHSADPEVFIRSLATRGALGGLSRSAADAMSILDAWGADVVLVETVGVGQDELEITRTADTTLVVMAPGLGDEVQASKAGILECADVFAVNKADRPGAADAVRDLEHMLDLAPPSPWRAPVRCTVATDGTGVIELLDAIRTHAAYLDTSEGRSARRRARDRAELRARVERLLMGAVDDLLDSDHCTSDIVDGRQVTANVAARRVIAAIREGREIR
jgi:LAO/AO transport system kinase